MILNFDNCSIDVERVDENNLKQGKATITYNNGHSEETNYIDDVKNGETIYHFEDFSYEQFTYVNGVEQGPATYSKGMETEEYNYIDGVKTGAGTIIKQNFEINKNMQTPFGSVPMTYMTTEHVFYKNDQINGFSVQDIFGEENRYIIRYYVNGEVKFSLKTNSAGLDFGYVNEKEEFITLFEEDDILFANNIDNIKELLFKIND